MSNPQLNISDDSGTFYWKTEYYHCDNAFTMQDFIENHLPIHFEVILDDGSYAEVQDSVSGAVFSLDSKGDGDFFHHVVCWNLLR